MKPGLSVVFPCYNEEASIAGVLERAVGFLPALAVPFEIVVVDDGSRDATSERVRDFAAGHPLVTVQLVAHPKNRGYGAALRSGLDAATGDWIFYTDGDGQFDIRELGLLWARRAEAEFVIGYRQRRRDPFGRRLLGRAYTVSARWLFGLAVRDLNCAFKLFRREVVAGLDLQTDGALINAEILARARRRGARILEIPVTHLPRQAGVQTGGSLGVVRRAAAEYLRLWLRLRRSSRHERRPAS